MTATLIQRKPIIRVAPAEIRMVVVVPVKDGERAPVEQDDCDLELEVGSRGRTVTVPGKIVKVENGGPTQGPSRALPAGATSSIPNSTDYRLTIKTDGTWADGPARR